MKISTITLSSLTALMLSSGHAAINVGFADLDLSTPPTTSYSGGGVYYNGNDSAGGFSSGGVNFTNNYNATYGSWDGWAYSTTTDTTTADYTNQYSAFTGTGSGDSVYGVYYAGFAGSASTLTLDANGSAPLSMQVTNTTYAALSMENGDGFAKQFGGASGDDADWFLLTIRGFDASNQETGIVEHYLADFRFTDNSLDYIVDEWETISLSGLGTNVSSLQFELTSSDVGDYGMNTPGYFAMDNFTAVPEPASFAFLVGILALIVTNKRTRR